MSKISQNPEPEEIAKLLKDSVHEPHQFNELMKTWNRLFEVGKLLTAQSFADVEAAAIMSVADVPETTPHATVGRQVGEMLEKFESPAYLVRENGLIKAQNTAAFMAFNLGSGATLADLPLSLEMDKRRKTWPKTAIDRMRPSAPSSIV